MLDFNSKKEYAGKDYFKKEGLVIKRHCDNRSKDKDKMMHGTKAEYVEKFIENGQRKYIRAIAWTFILFGALLALYPIASLLFGFAI